MSQLAKTEEKIGMAESKTEEEQLSDYAGQALRGAKFGIFEQLVCQHLVQATVSGNPLRKIQLVVEAALMLDEEKQKQLQIALDTLEIVRAITEAFHHRNEITNKNYSHLVELKFGFDETEHNYNRFIKPWYHNERLTHYPQRIARLSSEWGKSYRIFYCRACMNQVANDITGPTGIEGDGRHKTCKFCGVELQQGFNEPPPYVVIHGFEPHESTPKWRMFFVYCHGLAASGYNQVKTDFLKWAMPFAMQLMRQLTQAVRPEIYNEIAKMFIKVRGESET